MFCNPLPRRITSNVRLPALSNERHEVDTVHAAIEPNIESNKQKIFELKKIECFIFEWVRLSSVIEHSEVELLTKKTRMEQNRSIDPALKQLRLFEVLVPFITVFPYSELALSTDYSLRKVYQGKILTLQFWKPKSSSTMTVRFCSRFPVGHRTHKHTHTWKKFCVSFRSTADCIELFRSKKFNWVRWKVLFDFAQFYLVSDYYWFLGSCPKSIYHDLLKKRSRWYRAKFNQSPEII